MQNKPAYATILSQKAGKELIASFDWYEAQQKGLGDRFAEKALQRINNIAQYPELFSFKNKFYREANISPFPFVIIYRVNQRKKIIRIVSIFHTSQNPRKKYQ